MNDPEFNYLTIEYYLLTCNFYMKCHVMINWCFCRLELQESQGTQ